MTFEELKLNENILEAISHMGFVNATPIQEMAIPKILDNKDLIACAQTGTGKTAAFVLPILHKIVEHPTSTTSTLIIVPTRELAIQIDQEIQGLSYFLSVSSTAIYGGGDGKEFAIQEQAIKNGADIVVATPGRLLAFLKMGNIKLSRIKHLILDEADKMLDMGFLDDIEKIIQHIPHQRQTLMFSATMPPKIRSLAKKILVNPDEISLSISKPAEGVSQNLYLTHDPQKNAVLTHIIKERPDYNSIIIFTSAKSKINDIVTSLRRNGYASQGISSDLDQHAREEVLRGFRSKRTRILVATDVMSRGIDIKEINMVINYDVPHDAEDYVHRIGRTARANTKGEAFTLVNEKDMHKMVRIEKLIDMSLPKLALPEELGQGPEWKTTGFKPNNRRGSSRPNPNRPRKTPSEHQNRSGKKPNRPSKPNNPNKGE
jgi:Superfamily II DNA and RNA helicases